MRFSGSPEDFLITQTPGIVKSRCGDENPRGPEGSFSSLRHSEIVKSRYDDENLWAPGIFLSLKNSEIVKSRCGDEIFSSLRHSEIVKSRCGDEILRGPGGFSYHSRILKL